jgi:hypothetical protein
LRGDVASRIFHSRPEFGDAPPLPLVFIENAKSPLAPHHNSNCGELATCFPAEIATAPRLFGVALRTRDHPA